MSMLLALNLVKGLQFALVVSLRVGSSNGTKLKVDDNFGQLPPI